MTRQEETANIILRLMSGLPAKMNRTIHALNSTAGINLYKYRKGNTYPLIPTFLSFCFDLDLDPGWFISMACRVQQGELSEEQALQILAHHKSIKIAVDSTQSLIIDEFCRNLDPQ